MLLATNIIPARNKDNDSNKQNGKKTKPYLRKLYSNGFNIMCPNGLIKANPAICNAAALNLSDSLITFIKHRSEDKIKQSCKSL